MPSYKLRKYLMNALVIAFLILFILFLYLLAFLSFNLLYLGWMGVFIFWILVLCLGSLYSHSFSWDDVPGNDTEKLIDFLKQCYNVDWVKAENIKKSDESSTISASAGNNSLSLSLNNDKTEANASSSKSMVNPNFDHPNRVPKTAYDFKIVPFTL